MKLRGKTFHRNELVLRIARARVFPNRKRIPHVKHMGICSAGDGCIERRLLGEREGTRGKPTRTGMFGVLNIYRCVCVCEVKFTDARMLCARARFRRGTRCNPDSRISTLDSFIRSVPVCCAQSLPARLYVVGNALALSFSPPLLRRKSERERGRGKRGCLLNKGGET